MESLPINKQFNFKLVKHLKCYCGTEIPYGMGNIMSFIEMAYIECPYCNTTHQIDIEEFIIKQDGTN